MKSIKNHLSLVIALLSILFAIQVFTIVDRSIDAYKKNLASNYSVVMVAQLKIETENIKSLSPLISEVSELSPDSVIKRLNTSITGLFKPKLVKPKFPLLSKATGMGIFGIGTIVTGTGIINTLKN